MQLKDYHTTDSLSHQDLTLAFFIGAEQVTQTSFLGKTCCDVSWVSTANASQGFISTVLLSQHLWVTENKPFNYLQGVIFKKKNSKRKKKSKNKINLWPWLSNFYLCTSCSNHVPWVPLCTKGNVSLLYMTRMPAFLSTPSPSRMLTCDQQRE